MHVVALPRMCVQLLFNARHLLFDGITTILQARGERPPAADVLCDLEPCVARHRHVDQLDTQDVVQPSHHFVRTSFATARVHGALGFRLKKCAFEGALLTHA
jgi:hypothetical protein